jgi:predicted ATP-dependent serine protease
MSKQLTYAQKYYQKMKAKELGITVEEYQAMKGNSVGDMKIVEKKAISFEKVVDLSAINVNEKMLVTHKTGIIIDKLISYESGIPVGTNIMCTGDPGVGKTTVLLHTLAHLQKNNKKLKCLFISCEMGKIQLYKYMQRFPVFGCVKTLIASDFLNDNMKDVVEGLLKEGYDYVLIDSMAEMMESVREDNGMSLKEVEKWLIDLCVTHNEGQNDREVYSSFLLINQVTKGGVFVGSNKVKHMTDAHMEMKRESMKDGGGTYIVFTKNRNGQADMRWSYQLNNNDIHYGYLVDETDSNEEPKQFEVIKKDSPDFQVNRNGADINFNASNN